MFHVSRFRLSSPDSRSHGSLPASLHSFLERGDIAFVGKQIGVDIGLLKVQYNVAVKDSIELGSLAKRRGVVRDARCGLQDLCAKVLCRYLEKEECGVRLSNWDNDLTPAQINYSALDAYASYLIFHKLNESGNVGDAVTEESVRDGLYVSIHARPKSDLVAGYGTVVIREEKVEPDRISVRINSVVASSIKIKTRLQL